MSNVYCFDCERVVEESEYMRSHVNHGSKEMIDAANLCVANRAGVHLAAAQVIKRDILLAARERAIPT